MGPRGREVFLVGSDDGTLSRPLSRPGNLPPRLLRFSLLSQLQQIPLQRLEAGERRPLSDEGNKL